MEKKKKFKITPIEPKEYRTVDPVTLTVEELPELYRAILVALAAQRLLISQDLYDIVPLQSQQFFKEVPKKKIIS